MTQDVAAGIAHEIYIEVEGDDQAAMFSDDGMHEFVSRATVSGPSGVRVRTGFTYIWTFDIQDYTDVASSRIPFVAPATSYPGIRLKNDLDEWVYWYRDVVGQYESFERAAEVLAGYESAIGDYIEECMCPLECYETFNGFTTNSLGYYNGDWNPGNDGCTPVRNDLKCTGTVGWDAWTYVPDTYIRLQRTDDDGESWTTLATCDKDHDITYSGTAPACSYFRVWLETQGGNGETTVNAHFTPNASSSGDCTPAIEDAFALVPTY